MKRINTLHFSVGIGYDLFSTMPIVMFKMVLNSRGEGGEA